MAGSEVSGAELGRADYDLIPHSYNWVITGLHQFLYQNPIAKIRITNRSLHYEYVRITGLMWLHLNEKDLT